MTPVLMVSEHHKEYSLGLRQCETLARLKEFLEHWAPFASDAYKIGIRLDEVEFIEFRHGLLKESTGKYAGDKWSSKYGNIVIPDLLMRVSVVAMKFKVPWGMAFMRLQQAGLITEENGIYVCHVMEGSH